LPLHIPSLYLNAYEIKPYPPYPPLKAIRLPIPTDGNLKKYVTQVLRNNRIAYHYLQTNYLEYESGIYIYNTDKWKEVVKNDDILRDLEQHVKEVKPTSYVMRNPLLGLIEQKLLGVKGLYKVMRRQIDEHTFCFNRDKLEDVHFKSSLFEFHPCFTYRVEFIENQLLLVLLPSIKVKAKVTLRGLIQQGIPYEYLIGLPFRVRQQFEDEESSESYIGFLEEIKDEKAIIKPAGIVDSPSYEVNLDAAFPIGNIYHYRQLAEILGEDFQKLIDFLGMFTFTRERQKRIQDAPLRMLREVKNLVDSVFRIEVFPIKIQHIEYKISEEPVKLVEERES